MDRHTGNASIPSSSRALAPPAAPAARPRRSRVETFEPPNAHDRLQRMHALKQFYEHSDRMPAKPRSRHDLDVLKERHQFVRDSAVEPASLPREDQLASKFYDSLFKEYAVVNLKHYKSGAIALRWRTEDEVLAGIGHLTCGSLRCPFHEPSPAILDALASASASASDSLLLPDPDSTAPLVDARLDELEMPFGYVEAGEKKVALVKVVLCRECAKKLRFGREKARAGRVRDHDEAVERGEEGRERSERRRRRSSRSHGDDRSPPAERRTRRDSEVDNRSREATRLEGDGGDDYRPDLPPDLAAQRSRHSGKRRRSASPQR